MSCSLQPSPWLRLLQLLRGETMTTLTIHMTAAEWDALDALDPRDQPRELARILGPRRAKQILDASHRPDVHVVASIVSNGVVAAVPAATEVQAA